MAEPLAISVSLTLLLLLLLLLAFVLLDDRLRNIADNELRLDTRERIFDKDDEEEEGLLSELPSYNGFSAEREGTDSLDVLRITLGKDLRQLPREVIGVVVDMVGWGRCLFGTGRCLDEVGVVMLVWKSR